METNNEFKVTNVSQVILRQLPTYEPLKKLKRFPCKVNFDFISISTDNINEVEVNKYFFIKHSFKNKLYQDCSTYSFKLTGIHAFSLLKNKREHNKSNFEHQIQIIPTHYNSTEDWLKVLFQIMGCITISNHKINRLDISFVNDYLSPAFIFYCTHFKWKQSVTRFDQVNYTKGNITGLQSKGSRSAVSCYGGTSKSCKSNQKKVDRNQSFNLEFQIKSKSLISSYGILGLHDVCNFLKKDKLFFVEFYDITKTYNGLKKKELKRFVELQRMAYSNGLNPSRYILNSNKNFARDYRKLLIPLKMNDEKARVSYCLKRRFHEFIRNWEIEFQKSLLNYNNLNFTRESLVNAFEDFPSTNLIQ